MVRRSLATLFLAGLALGGCGPDPVLRASDGHVSLPTVPGNPAAGYMTLHGGPEDSALVAVSVPVALRAEIHESMAGGGEMRPVTTVPIPARGEVRLEPGGLHVMIFGLSNDVRPGGGVPFILRFADGTTVRYVAPARAPGQPPRE